MADVFQPKSGCGSSLDPGTSDRNRIADLEHEVAVLRRELEGQKTAQQLISERLRIERAIAHISRELVRPDRVDLIAVLRVLGEAIDADRCHLFRLPEDSEAIDAIYTWCRPGFELPQNSLDGLDTTCFPWIAGWMKQNRCLLINNMEDLTADAVTDRHCMEKTGAQALMVVPMMHEGTLTGVLVAVCTEPRPQWPDDSMNLFRTTSMILESYFQCLRTETALRQSEQRLRMITDGSSDTIWTTDLAMNITYVSPSVERTRGFTPQEAMSQSADEIFPPDSLRKILGWFSEEMTILASGGDPAARTRTIEVEEYRKDGTTVPLEITMRYLLDDEGKPVGIIGVSRDITDRRRAEYEKHGLEIQLRQAQKMEAIGTLAGGIAHDFNNMLVPILGYAELVKFRIQELDPELAANLDQILVSARRARDLVGHILAFARDREGGAQKVRVDVIARETVQLLQASLPVSVAITCEIADHPPLVRGDPTQLQQILMNLCLNATQAMPAGGELSIGLGRVRIHKPIGLGRGSSPSGDYVRISVSDTGMGIEPENLGRIFDPYFTTKQYEHGSGLGLAVVHGIVRAHGGFTEAESELGIGTTVRVFLPAMEGESFLEDDADSPTGTESVLVVDDEPSVADLIARALANRGYGTTVLVSGPDAIGLLEDDPARFDLVITDQSMPDMTGRELASRIRDLRPDLPVVLCTGFSNEMDPAKARDNGIDALLMKPILGSEMCRMVRNVLDAAAAAREDDDRRADTPMRLDGTTAPPQ